MFNKELTARPTVNPICKYQGVLCGLFNFGSQRIYSAIFLLEMSI